MSHSPLPIFDSIDFIDNMHLQIQDPYDTKDIHYALAFLKSYKGSIGTYNSYRREIERLIHWSTLIANKKLIELRRSDIEEFVVFCKSPIKTWIGIKKAPRFIHKTNKRMPNPEWRPFVATISKAAHRLGKHPDIKKFELSQGAIKELFAILSTFFNYLIQEEYAYMNPVSLIRQKSNFIRKLQGSFQIRRLSELQWHYVVRTTMKLADKNPKQHERTLFIVSALYSLYLRISELTASIRWTPQMNHFQRDGDGNWWFTTVGKGNKERKIAVSNAMLEALKRWRTYLGLSPVPSPADNQNLLPKYKGKGPIKNTTYIRKIIQFCFDQTIEELIQDNLAEEAESLRSATVHWLRHTGISDDVKRRPREHVRDDAGHSSSAVTDKYIDIELRERHQTAKNKPILDKD